MDITAELAALTARMRTLEDLEGIRALIASYGPAVDSGDAGGAAALWEKDGTHDVGGDGINVGRAAITALLDSPTHRGLIEGGAAHVLSPVTIVLDEDRATATGYSCIFCWTGTDFVAHRIAANHWTLARTAAGWRVSVRVNRLLDGTEAARALLA